MSVGKESIKRAASAGAKKTSQGEGTASVAETKVVSESAKAAESKAASPKAAKKPAAKKTAAKTTTRKTTAKKSAGTVKTSVLTPGNAEEIQAKFISDRTEQPENAAGPVHISQELPIYLL